MADLAAVDWEFYKGKVLYILEQPLANLADLDMHFVDTPRPDVFPSVHQELFPNGAQIGVTEENKKRYLTLLCEHRLRGAVQEQLEALRRGFGVVVPDEPPVY